MWVTVKTKPINNLLILSFSLSQITLVARKISGFEINCGRKYVIKCVDARSKTVCD